MEVDGYQTLSLMKSHCKMSITKDQSLKVSCSSREVALNIHYIFFSCVSFNHLLVICRGYQFTCANQQKCIPEFYRCDGNTDCSDGNTDRSDGSDEQFIIIHYIFLVKNVQEVPTFCHGSCVSFNHLLVTCGGDEIPCANQQQCIHASARCNGFTD